MEHIDRTVYNNDTHIHIVIISFTQMIFNSYIYERLLLISLLRARLSIKATKEI